jgi:hypothetical protein
MDGDGSGLVVHAVDALAGEQERLARAVLTRLGRLADRERLVPGAAFDHMDADTSQCGRGNRYRAAATTD